MAAVRNVGEHTYRPYNHQSYFNFTYQPQHCMKLRHIGYACINMQIEVTTNRTFRLARLSEEAVQQTTALNFAALRQILEWNQQHNIRLFRIGSSLIPYASHERFTFDWQTAFANEIQAIRAFIQQHGMRLSMHPGQYTVLNSPDSKTVASAVRELEWQSQLVDLLDPQQGVVVLHIGGAYGDKAAAIDRFARHFDQYLSQTAKRRLVIENDDVTFDLDDVLHLHEKIHTPIIFDILHHKVNHTGNDWKNGLAEKLARVVETWRGHVPKVHLSSPKAGSATSHADYIEQADFDELLFWMDQCRAEGFFDLMIEAKLKDKAVQALSCELFNTVADQ